MTNSSTTNDKVCISCGKPLDGKKRMRDDQGNYWCLRCGIADEQRKAEEIGRTIDVKGYIKPLAEKSKAKGAAAKAEKAPKIRLTIEQTDRRRVIIMLIALGVVAMIAVWYHLTR